MNYLNEERKRQNLTVFELAQKANLPKATVEKILFNVVKNPRIDTMQAIEKALGLNQPPLKWTEEEQALGIGSYPTYLSDKEKELIEIGSEILRIHGEQYYNTVITMLKALIK